MVFVYKDTLMISNCLMAHLPSLSDQAFKTDNNIYDKNLHWRNAFDFIVKSKHSDNEKPFQKANLSHAPLKRLTRLHRPSPKYFNHYFET